MARIRSKRAKSQPFATLTFHQLASLRVGASWDPAAFASDDERREAWQVHRERLLGHDLGYEHNKGRRPQAYWEYDVGRPELIEPSDEREYPRLAYLAEHDLLTADEQRELLDPMLRADGELHPWDVEAQDAVREGIARRLAHSAPSAPDRPRPNGEGRPPDLSASGEGWRQAGAIPPVSHP